MRAAPDVMSALREAPIGRPWGARTLDVLHGGRAPTGVA